MNSVPRVPHTRGNPGRNRKPTLLDLVCAFDIETSYLPEYDQSIMYVWQFQLGEYTIVGRTWDEFLQFIQRISVSIKKNERLVCYIFNASYEFSFLKGIYKFEPREVFCMDRRKVARFEMAGAVEFRCAYIHSNMSLDQFTKKMGCKTHKLVGSLDYSKIRYPWTELTEEEMAYCINDVIALQEAIQIEMEADGDTLETIPLTSTGYVRRKCKAAMKKKPAFYSYIQDQVPDYELYVALREAFRGGNTHANHLYAGHILENVHSVDRSSSYPDVLVNHEYPVSFFSNRGPCTVERLMKNINEHHRAAIVRICIFNVHLKNPYNGCPYLPYDKCRNVIDARLDNGRILTARCLETSLTDIDWKIVCEQYSFDNICIYDSWFARYGKLPKEFTDTINEMYREKTALKGDPSQQIYYEKTKAMINALYGMTAQNPLKLNFIFEDNDFIIKDYNPVTELLKYNKHAFLVYQWGVWCTAWARYELQVMVDAAGDGVHTESCFIYCDTDSVKYLGNIDDKIEEYNKRQIQISRVNGGSALDSKGNEHCLGVYEREADYDRFRTWGAKRYAYEQDGRCHVTTAGVVKRKGECDNEGGKELEAAGGLEAYVPGFTFTEAGGTEALYNDNVDMAVEIDGHILHITDNVCIRPSEYTLGVTGEYKRLLKYPELLLDLWTEYERNKNFGDLNFNY